MLKKVSFTASLLCCAVFASGRATWGQGSSAPPQQAPAPVATPTPAPTPTPTPCAGPDRTCAAGYACNHKGQCIACGGSRQKCCPTQPHCGTGFFCSGAECHQCGQKAGEPCCSAGGGTCSNNMTCSKVTLTCLISAPACGTQGASCCTSGAACASGLKCGATVRGKCDAIPGGGL